MDGSDNAVSVPTVAQLGIPHTDVMLYLLNNERSSCFDDDCGRQSLSDFRLLC